MVTELKNQNQESSGLPWNTHLSLEVKKIWRHTYPIMQRSI